MVQVNGPSSNGDFRAPGNETEQIVARLAAEVLGLERVSINDNFFSLGGHSLVVTQLLSRVRDAFEIELPLRDLFEEPTVAGWAQTIDAIRWAAHGPQQHTASENYEEGEL
jgi:acyl carrier protein